MKFQKLNEDCSWLWKINGLTLLVDPWFTPSQIDLHRFFSEQFHVSEQPNVSTLPQIDYLFISNPFTDHCNKETLLEFDSSIPIIAKKSILKKISRWNHFKHLLPLKDSPIPITEYKPQGILDFVHSAYLIETDSGRILFAPHGAKTKDLPKAEVLITTTTRYQLPFWLGGTVNLGITHAESLFKRCGAKLFLATHDEKKRGAGLVEKLASKDYAADVPFVTCLKTGEEITFKAFLPGNP